ncbi:hypothetical protein PMAYCL1PPCAC_14556, partial [Pristionchus mayeri]
AMPVIIHNQEQQSYWTSKQVEKGNYLLLGLLCNSATNAWQWADGSSVDFKPSSYTGSLTGACTAGCVWFIHDSSGNWISWCDADNEPFTIFCTQQLKIPVPSPDGCYNFEDDSEDEACYEVVSTAENWQNAQLNCAKVGANLASIHNAQENAFVRRLAVSNGAVNGVFLGATISGKGNGFGWIDGSNWDYANFHPGFPITGAGNCLAMDTSTSSGQWMNIDCSDELPVACIRDPLPDKEADLVCSDGAPQEGVLITTPGFPFNASIPCDFFLVVDAGKKVEIEIVLLEANTCCDSLAIYDGYLGGHAIATLTGEKSNVTYTATSNTMKVSWLPNGGVGVMGMAMTYRGV